MAKPPITWSRMGANGEVDASVVGTNGTRAGTITYSACKFGNGATGFTTTGPDSITWTNVFASGMAECAIDFWWKPNFNQTASKPLWYLLEGGYEIGILLGGGVFSFWIYHGGTYDCYYTFTPTAFSSGDVIHMRTVISSSASNGNRLKIIQNGTSLSTASVVNDGTTSPPANMDFVLPPPAAAGAGLPDATFDNIKFFDYAKTDELGDRFNERGWMNDQVFTS